jgi:asparagine synthase (glutamine-hydrolysing)
MRDAGQQIIQTITLSFEEFRGSAQDEAPVASQIAALYGTSHTNRVVTEGEFLDDLPRLLAAMDQPSVDGINTWFVSKAARESGLKVAISGLGGDELFGGYSSFRDIPRCVSWMRFPSRIPLLGDAFKGAMSALARVFPNVSPKSAGLVKYGGDYSGAYLLRRALFMPWELQRMLDADMVCEGLERLSTVSDEEDLLTDDGPKTTFGRVATLESALYMRNQLLRDTDWASMAHSLEVRVPLVDRTLLEAIAPFIVASESVDGKALLGRSPSRPLPETVIRRQKTGFATPIEHWIRHATMAPASPRPVAHESGAGWARRWACQMLAPVTHY